MKYSVETKKKAIEYYLVGYSAQKVACLIGANEATIRKWINEAKMKCGKNPSYYVSLTSRHMCESLSNYGIVPQKTGFEIFPDNIPKVYIRDFIRGVFDGDGITDIRRFRSGFVGSNNLVNRILVELNRCDLSIFNTKSKNICYFLGGKKFSRELFEYMYNDSTLYLKRKYDRMKYICNN